MRAHTLSEALAYGRGEERPFLCRSTGGHQAQRLGERTEEEVDLLHLRGARRLDRRGLADGAGMTRSWLSV